MDHAELKRRVAEQFLSAGFHRKSGGWYKSGPDAILVMALQKSDFGNFFYLNVGVCIKALSDEPFPKVNGCHVSMRADALLAVNGVSVDLGLNMDEGTPEDFDATLRVLNEQLLPMSSEFLDLEGLRRHHRQSTFKRALVLWQAREILEENSGVGDAMLPGEP